jgi:hypothetical protein
MNFITILPDIRCAILIGRGCGRQRLARLWIICYNAIMAKIKKATPASDKPRTDLQTFIQNVNKKDKLNGLKITFGFSKRKRK